MKWIPVKHRCDLFDLLLPPSVADIEQNLETTIVNLVKLQAGRIVTIPYKMLCSFRLAFIFRAEAPIPIEDRLCSFLFSKIDDVSTSFRSGVNVID